MTSIIKGVFFLILLSFFLFSEYFDKFLNALITFVDKANTFFSYFNNADPIFGVIALLFGSTLIFYLIYSYKN